MAGDNDLPEEAQEDMANNNDPNNNAGVQLQVNPYILNILTGFSDVLRSHQLIHFLERPFE